MRGCGEARRTEQQIVFARLMRPDRVVAVPY